MVFKKTILDAKSGSKNDLRDQCTSKPLIFSEKYSEDVVKMSEEKKTRKNHGLDKYNSL